MVASMDTKPTRELFPIDTTPRIFAISQASQYCEARGIDPYDDKLQQWRLGKVTIDELTTGPADSELRLESRKFAVTVAKTMRMVGFDSAQQMSDISNPVFVPYDNLITLTIIGQMTLEDFTAKSSDFVFSLGLNPPATSA